MKALISLFVIAVLAAGAWLGIRAVKRKFALKADEMSKLVREGIAVTGRIASTERRRMARGSNFDYFISYAFTSRDGEDYSKELRVASTSFDDYSEGQAIDIVYLRNDPSVSATREMVEKVRNTTTG